MGTNHTQLVSYMIRTEDGDLSYNAKYETIRRPPKYHILGIDRNVGNIALSNGQIIKPPECVTDRLQQLQTTGKRIQRKMARRKKSNRKRRTPGSNRYNKQARRLARNQRKMKDAYHIITYKKSRIIADTTKDVVFERLRTTNMTKSAKGTRENPGRNIAQKSDLNKSILGQNWYDLEQQVRYNIVGDTHKVEAHYTSQRCHMCVYTAGKIALVGISNTKRVGLRHTLMQMPRITSRTLYGKPSG